MQLKTCCLFYSSDHSLHNLMFPVHNIVVVVMWACLSSAKQARWTVYNYLEIINYLNITNDMFGVVPNLGPQQLRSSCDLNRVYVYVSIVYAMHEADRSSVSNSCRWGQPPWWKVHHLHRGGTSGVKEPPTPVLNSLPLKHWSPYVCAESNAIIPNVIQHPQIHSFPPSLATHAPQVVVGLFLSVLYSTNMS